MKSLIKKILKESEDEIKFSIGDRVTKDIIKKILKENINPQIDIGDIFITSGTKEKDLIRITDIRCGGTIRDKEFNTPDWGKQVIEYDGCDLMYQVSTDQGITWEYEDEDGHWVEVAWIKNLIEKGWWELLHKNMDFFDILNESEEGEFNFLTPENILGLEYYNQNEYTEEGTVYKVIQVKNGSSALVEWDYTDGKLTHGSDSTWVSIDGLIDDLNRGFYVVKTDFNIADTFNGLYESLSKPKFSVGDRVVVNHSGYHLNNDLGTILEVEDDILIALDDWHHGHDGNGDRLCGSNKCIYLGFRNINSFIQLLPDTYSMLNKLYESEDDSLEWAKDVISQDPFIGKHVRINGKTFAIENRANGSMESWKRPKNFIIGSWSGYYPIIGEIVYRDVDSYIIDMGGTYPRVYFPKEEFKYEDVQ